MGFRFRSTARPSTPSGCGRARVASRTPPRRRWTAAPALAITVTGIARINGLYDLAFEEQDRPAQVMLQWFITEQVEEEASIDEIVSDEQHGGGRTVHRTDPLGR